MGTAYALPVKLVPEISQLKNTGFSFHEIGHMYNVTGQAIQHFMKRHNLPYKDARNVRKVKRLDAIQASINAAQADVNRKTREMRKVMGL